MSNTSNLLNHTPISNSAELRVLCLYRVSSNGQLYHNEKNEADIPMQCLECRRFADMMGWKIVSFASLKPALMAALSKPPDSL